jgi:hypothetical protein
LHLRVPRSDRAVGNVRLEVLRMLCTRAVNTSINTNNCDRMSSTQHEACWILLPIQSEKIRHFRSTSTSGRREARRFILSNSCFFAISARSRYSYLAGHDCMTLTFYIDCACTRKRPTTAFTKANREAIQRDQRRVRSGTRT